MTRISWLPGLLVLFAAWCLLGCGAESGERVDVDSGADAGSDPDMMGGVDVGAVLDAAMDMAADIDGATDIGIEPGADAGPPIESTCSETDRFVAVDEGPLITHILTGMDLGVTIADNTSYLTDDGQVRLYFWAGQMGQENTGGHSVLTADGLTVEYEAGLRIPPPYGHPKLYRLASGEIRMFHLVIGGLGSHISEDGINFELEAGARLTSEDAGLERIGGMSVVAMPGGGFRGYFSNLGIPGVPPSETVDRLKSATSQNQLDWTMDDGVRIGADAPHLTNRARQPFALKRAEACVTLFYQRVDRLPTTLYYATAPDGLTFTQEFELGIEGWSGPEAGANIQQLANGDYRLFFDAQSAELGNHIRTAAFALDHQ